MIIKIGAIPKYVHHRCILQQIELPQYILNYKIPKGSLRDQTPPYCEQNTEKRFFSKKEQRMKFSVFSLRISRRKKGKKIWKGLNAIQPETKLQNENKDRRENTERFKYNDLVTREKVITGLQSLRRRRKTKRNVDRRKNQGGEWVDREISLSF